MTELDFRLSGTILVLRLQMIVVDRGLTVLSLNEETLFYTCTKTRGADHEPLICVVVLDNV